MTLALIILLGAAVVAVVAIPYLDRSTVEGPPDMHDPEGQDLEEERDALMLAVRELDVRHDLAPERRAALRGRYERKAAQVMQRLEERSGGGSAPRRRAPLPLGWALALPLLIPSVALIGNYVLPRVSIDGTVTTNRSADLVAGRELQRLRRAVRDDPGAETLLALGEAYWQIVNADLTSPQDGAVSEGPRYLEETRETYERLVDLTDDAPGAPTATALRRLAYLDLLVGDVEGALPRLERAIAIDPGDADALYTLGQVRYALGRIGEAAEAWRAYLATPDGSDDETTADLAADAEALAPLIDAAEADRSVETLLAVADQLWEMDDRNRAASFYAEIVTQLSSEHPRAVRRLGMALFFAGNTDQAVLALERARALEADQPETLLFLGNAYRSLGDAPRALEAWRAYVDAVGGEANAGRVPELIAQAEGGSTPTASSPTTVAAASGAELFAANCATCHGGDGGGGGGPRLIGNARAANGANVEDIVRYGRGAMPGFGALLEDVEIERLIAHVRTLADR